jgi:hypothetical protein
MRFLSFSNKTKNSAKKIRTPGASSVQSGLPARETRQNLPFFSHFAVPV